MKIGEIRLGFVGFGHMAQILCKALLSAKVLPRSHVLSHRRDPAKARENEEEFGVTSTSLAHLVEASSVVLLAVRPSQAPSILEELAKYPFAGRILISVMAGISIDRMRRFFKDSVPIVRTMPNIASAVGEGATLLAFGEGCSPDCRSGARLLFGAMGPVFEIPESQMDIGCALAGSGPGFVIELIEAMARAGERDSIPYPQALQIAAQTFAGAAELIRKGSSPQELLVQIATPGGVTAAGLQAMRHLGVDSRFREAINASAQRSKTLSD